MIPTLAELGPVHFVGIGGSGMSGLARILLARGVQVSGSDAKDSRQLAALRALGARVFVGHRPEQVPETGTVVWTPVVRRNNPEVREAEHRGLRVIVRAELLAALMRDSTGVAVAGTHGKTTTTSMLTVALQHCGADPSFAIGGNLSGSGVNAHHGSGQIFVAEADESDGSFLLFHPHVGVVTNVEPDHLDHFGTAEAVHRAFDDFARTVRADGFLVACADDPGARQVAATALAAGVDVRTYGGSEDADLRITELVLSGATSRYVPVLRGVRLGPVSLAVPGAHNARNASAALLAGLGLGFPEAQLRQALAGFTGTRRRFEAKGQAGGVRVVDDYAHHPTELAATLAAAREVAGGGRVVAVFQPHRYTRTAVFTEEFGQALGAADVVVVLEVYPAGEDPLPGVTGAAVAAAVPLPGDRVVFEPSWSAVPERVAGLVRPGDLVLTLGAGDVTMLGPEVLARLEPDQ